MVAAVKVPPPPPQALSAMGRARRTGARSGTDRAGAYLILGAPSEGVRARLQVKIVLLGYLGVKRRCGGWLPEAVLLLIGSFTFHPSQRREGWGTQVSLVGEGWATRPTRMGHPSLVVRERLKGWATRLQLL